MTEKTPSLVADIFDAFEEIFRVVAGFSAEDYLVRRDLSDRVNWNLVVAGEAAYQLQKIESPMFQSAPSLKELVALRHRIVHGYSTIDDRVIWTTIHGDLADLLTQLRPFLDEIEQ